ncbi:MAG: hypothetical protein WDA42_08325 [Candidatus Bathyarchaeia archaeon]
MSDRQTTSHCPLCEDAQRENEALKAKIKVLRTENASLRFHLRAITNTVQKAQTEMDAADSIEGAFRKAVRDER